MPVKCEPGEGSSVAWTEMRTKEPIRQEIILWENVTPKGGLSLLQLSHLSFPDFDLAPKRNEKLIGYCGLDLV